MPEKLNIVVDVVGLSSHYIASIVDITPFQRVAPRDRTESIDHFMTIVDVNDRETILSRIIARTTKDVIIGGQQWDSIFMHLFDQGIIGRNKDGLTVYYIDRDVLIEVIGYNATLLNLRKTMRMISNSDAEIRRNIANSIVSDSFRRKARMIVGLLTPIVKFTTTLGLANMTLPSYDYKFEIGTLLRKLSDTEKIELKEIVDSYIPKYNPIDTYIINKPSLHEEAAKFLKENVLPSEIPLLMSFNNTMLLGKEGDKLSLQDTAKYILQTALNDKSGIFYRLSLSKLLEYSVDDIGNLKKGDNTNAERKMY